MMSLIIKESNGITILEGIINSASEKDLKERLEFLLTYTSSVIINIDKVTSISRNGLKVIENLFSQAKQNNKVFCVVGYGCNDIYNFNEFSIPNN
jgi:anti-anti-sigma regulatory factor